jgi:hypothetical protein
MDWIIEISVLQRDSGDSLSVAVLAFWEFLTFFSEIIKE